MVGVDRAKVVKEYFLSKYLKKTIPWDIKKPDFNLVAVVAKHNIFNATSLRPQKALDLGCGTGNDAIWLAQTGFAVTGIDTASEAIYIAEKKAEKLDVYCKFMVADFFTDAIPDSPFKFIYDRGLFHCFRREKEKKLFAKLVYDNLEEEGFWLSLISSDENDGSNYMAPPKRSQKEIVSSISDLFEIIALYRSNFDSLTNYSLKAWICLMKKRC